MIAYFFLQEKLLRLRHPHGLARLIRNPELASPKEQIQPNAVNGVPTVTFCNTTQTPLVVNSYTITPDNIQPNEDVTIVMHTTLTETVTSGTINEVAKVDGFPIINENYDLCTEIIQAGLKCPLAPGNYDISQTLQIGSIPISGTVTSVTKLYDQNKQLLACVQVVVTV
ncbi:hypothetical protein RFI_00333 [Reticulomyxa filosa]|uniref:MD-2-related lipid-recognition domain-containing protein n=1 Tax=Reticulomyxa filosa TaxID=46433 RepID=X6PF46_RETFI|nr:hypothetical protein RFI_00333 [Reticulomyxa filosa]|eukprot:ETO36728.1 hypothetical protein RFI_00333 [Reticulomyxa filosa]